MGGNLKQLLTSVLDAV